MQPRVQVHQDLKGHIKTKIRITFTTEGQIEIIKDAAHTTDQWMNLLDEITITADIETVDNAHFTQ